MTGRRDERGYFHIVLYDMEVFSRQPIVPGLETAAHGVGRWIEVRLKNHDITQAEAHILGRLASGGVCSMNDLHLEFCHRRSTLTNIVDRLERKGLVRREPNSRSRRSIDVKLTNSGLSVAQLVIELLASVEDSVHARTSPADIEGFQRVMNAVKEIVGE